MRKTKEVLRLKFDLGLGQRLIARSCGMGLGRVHDYWERAAAAGIGWPLPEGWSEEELEAKLFGNQPVPIPAVDPGACPRAGILRRSPHFPDDYDCSGVYRDWENRDYPRTHGRTAQAGSLLRSSGEVRCCFAVPGRTGKAPAHCQQLPSR